MRHTMKYETPSLVIVGTASALVLGIPGGVLDNPDSETSHAAEGISLGLDN
jgi:hypothetical protein